MIQLRNSASASDVLGDGGLPEDSQRGDDTIEVESARSEGAWNGRGPIPTAAETGMAGERTVRDGAGTGR